METNNEKKKGDNMNEDVKKFYQAVAQDKELQEKLHVAGKAHAGKELTEEEHTAIWERDVLPIAKEAGYVFTVADLKEYAESVKSESGELSEDELENVVGGCDELRNCYCFWTGIGFGGGYLNAMCFYHGIICDDEYCDY